MLQLITSLLFFLVVPVHSVSRPPGIFLNPPRDVYYKPLETVELPCKAEGNPRPSYQWKRNKVDFNPSGNDKRVVQLPSAGTLVFNSPEEKDEGFYQCFAKNDFGISVSINTNMRVAKLEGFQILNPEYHEPTWGMPYTLNCVAPTSVPDAEVIWIIKHELGFEAVNYDARVSMDREYRLRFANILKEDEQNGNAYACMAMNKIMRSNVQSHLHYLDVQGTDNYKKVEYLWSDPFDLFGLQGDTFSMQCIFAGNPTPDLQWERPDNKTLSSRAKLLSFAQILQIDDLRPEDAGSYSCWGTNAVSGGQKIMRTFNVRVKSRPYFVKKPEDVEISVGGNVEFSCVAKGDPEPDIDWTINGLDLTDPLLKNKDRFSLPVMTKIFFANVTESDHLVIQCNASNKYGYQFADVYLNVLAEAPELIVPPKPQVISAEGLDVNLTCKTTGKPDPIITWFKDGTSVSGGRFQIHRDGTLNIKGAVLADASHYLCQAVNKYGSISGEGTLVVRRKTRIEQKPGDLERNAGMDAKFTCSGTTDPEEVENLRVYWLKDGDEILANDQRTTTNYQDNSLTISGTIVRDSGTYTCVVTNGLDNAKASAVLTVRDKPEAPQNVFHRDCDKNVTIEWMPGSFNNAPLQYYILQFNTSFNPDQWNFAMKVNGSWTKVSYPVSPWVKYNFRLIAYNKIGPSSPSPHTPRMCISPSNNDLPAYHPKNLRTLGHERGKLYIEWTPIPPIKHNGPGFEYQLSYRRLGDALPVQVDNSALANWTTNYVIVDSGFVYTRYEIIMKATNTAGDADGNPSSIIGHSYEDTPNIIPTDFTVEDIGDTYADFTWQFTRSEIGKVNTRIRGEFMGFKIQFWQEGDKPNTIREFDFGPESAKIMTGNLFKGKVENMIPNTNMEAQISVKNNFYVGGPSDIIRFKTKPGFPGPVDFFRVINIGDTHVNLEWGRPMEDRGDLMGYDITYQLVNGLELGEMQDREPQINDPFTSNSILSGLEPRRKYRVYVFARTLKGRGEGYFIEFVVKKPITPDIPDFTIPNIGETYINVSWWIDAYKASGSVIYVEYRQIDGAEWLRTSDEVVHTWQKISNLESGTKYEIRIMATNGAVSIPSSIEEVVTHGNAVAYDLVENIGWFLGVLFSILLIIGLIVLFVLCYKHGFRFSQGTSGQVYNSNNAGFSDTAGINKAPDDSKGYNDYFDDKDNYEYDDGGRPPSYTSENGGVNPSTPGYGEYDDDHDRKGAQDDYDDQGYPPYNDNYYDRRDDDYSNRYNYGNRDYDYDNRGYDYDRKYDYYGQDGHRRQSGNMDLGRDDQGYDYDSEDTSRHPASKGGQAPSSTFV